MLCNDISVLLLALVQLVGNEYKSSGSEHSIYINFNFKTPVFVIRSHKNHESFKIWSHCLASFNNACALMGSPNCITVPKVVYYL